MTQTERLEYLITCLIKEQPEYEEISIPTERKNGCCGH